MAGDANIIFSRLTFPNVVFLGGLTVFILVPGQQLFGLLLILTAIYLHIEWSKGQARRR